MWLLRPNISAIIAIIAIIAISAIIPISAKINLSRPAGIGSHTRNQGPGRHKHPSNKNICFLTLF